MKTGHKLDNIAIILLSLELLGCRQLTPSHANDVGPTYLRIRNASGSDLSDVIFQGNHFGDLKNGAVSDYQLAAVTSWEISVGLRGDTNRLQYIYVDSPGPFAYPKGYFTCVLSLHDNYSAQGQHLDLSVEQDDPWQEPQTLALSVKRLGTSNVVFRLKNISTYLGSAGNDVIPALVQYLKDQYDDRYYTIGVLGDYGAVAKPALPVIRQYLNDDNEAVRSKATNAIRKIDPESRDIIR